MKMTDEQVINAEQVEATEPLETTETIETTTETEVTEPAKVELSEEQWPTKAINALDKQKRKVWQLKAEQKAMQAELQKFREMQTSKPSEGAPKVEDFDDYGQFLKAELRYEMKQEQTENTRKQQETQTSAQQQVWLEERQEILGERAAEAAAKIPDYVATFNEYQDVVSSLPDYINQAMLELDNAPMAFYALAKEGKLESLLEMSPARAIIEIGRAEDRGIAMTRAKPVTKAPAPIAGNRGTSMVSKSLSNMTPQEKLKWLNS